MNQIKTMFWLGKVTKQRKANNKMKSPLLNFLAEKVAVYCNYQNKMIFLKIFDNNFKNNCETDTWPAYVAVITQNPGSETTNICVQCLACNTRIPRYSCNSDSRITIVMFQEFFMSPGFFQKISRVFPAIV